MHIPFADTDHESKIGLDHLLASLLIACHDPFTQLLFLFEIQQGRPADFAKIALEGIESFRTSTVFLLTGRAAVCFVWFAGVIVVMILDVSARFTQIFVLVALTCHPTSRLKSARLVPDAKILTPSCRL